MGDDVSNAETDSDALVVRARHDREAFGLLFDRYYPRVFRYCARRMLDRNAAEDVASEAFLNVAMNLPGFSGRRETDFRRWLFRIATNVVNAHLRQAGRRQQLLETAARSGQWNRDAETHPAMATNDSLDWPVVYQTILALDEREQTIIMLRFFADLSHNEIADIVGATAGAVRTALSRALRTLRKRLATTGLIDEEPRIP